MRLYAGPSTHFIRDTTHNQISGKLQDAFFRYYGYKAPVAEVASWQNSLRAMAQVFAEAGRSRGMKGCYVYFMDRDTERFVRSRMVGSAA